MPSEQRPPETKEDKVVLQGICPTCAKPIRQQRHGSFTFWMFSSVSCDCDSSSSHKAASSYKLGLKELDGSERSKEAARADESGEPQEDGIPNLGSNLEVLELLGRGGMGAVYRVRDKESGLTRAVKVLRRDLAEDQHVVKRFEREANLVKELTHPNICAVYDFSFDESGVPFLSMEFIEGESLQDHLKANGSLQEAEALDLFIEIAEALDYAHKKGVIHRDIKPSNILFSMGGEGVSYARLIDFGIAHALPSASEYRETQDLTKTSAVFGTPTYMSPEQCLGFKLDQKSDIYSFGCLMYETLSGAPPFAGLNPIQVIVKQINEKAPSWSGTADGESYSPLEGIVLKCLEKDIGSRYQSMSELLEDLKLHRDGKRISRFKRSKERKSSHSAPEVASLVVGTLTASFYFLSLYVMSGWFLPLFAVLLSPLCVFKLARDVTRYSGNATGAGQWALIASVGWSTVCLSAVFLTAALFGTFEGFPSYLQSALVALFFFHWLALVATISALVCNIFFCEVEPLPARKLSRTFLSTFIVVGLLTGAFLRLDRLDVLASTALVKLPDLRLAIGKASSSVSRPNSSDYLKLGSLSLAGGHVDEAVHFTSEALSLETPTVDAYSRSAAIFSAAGKQDKALELANKCIELEPTSYLGYKTRADIYASSGDKAAALADYDRAIELNPGKSGDVHMSRAAMRAGSADLEGAIEDLSVVFGLRDEYREQAMLEIAILQERLGQMEKARNGYKWIVDRSVLKTGQNLLGNIGESLSTLAREISPREEHGGLVQLRRAFGFCKLGDESSMNKSLQEASSLGGTRQDLLSDFRRLSGLQIQWTPLSSEKGE